MNPIKGKEGFADNLPKRHSAGKVWETIFRISTTVGIIALIALLLNIANSAFGYVAIQNAIDPEELAINDIPLEQLHPIDLTYILEQHVSAGFFRAQNNEYPFEERTREEIYDLVIERVVEPEAAATWSLFDSLFHKDEINAEVAEKYPDAELIFTSWFSGDFLTSPQSADPERAGVRTAVFGSLWVVTITILFAFPMGVGAAIYLEEYAGDKWFNRLIQTNLFGGTYVGTLDPAAHHHQRPGSHPRCAGFLAPSQLWAGCHQMADDLAPCTPELNPWHPDRDDFSRLACIGRDCPAGCGGCFHIHHFRSDQPLLEIYDPADPDLPVDLPPTG